MDPDLWHDLHVDRGISPLRDRRNYPRTIVPLERGLAALVEVVKGQGLGSGVIRRPCYLGQVIQ